MIKTYALLAGAAVALLATPASATVLYNTIHPITQVTGVNQISATAIAPAAGPLAVSFYAPTATTIRNIQMLMNANNPLDGGSVTVWLVPNVGGSTGVAGTPQNNGLTGASFAFTGATSLGTILDSQLVTAGGTGVGQSASVVGLNVSVPVTAGEYWLGFTSTNSSAKLAFDVAAYLAGVGTTGQFDFTQTAFGQYSVVTGGGPSSLAPGMRVFEVSVSTPEPATLAILGFSLAGLGFVRRRRT
ncbi:MAG: PEP-CTERM sorting domain-containing protein [Acetobacteraceae bacterium]